MIKPADTVIRKERSQVIAEEQDVGAHFDGESERERKVGVECEVIVDIFKRNIGKLAGTYFMRVSLRSMVRHALILRYEIDLDQYSSESDLLKMVEIGGAALAEQDCEVRGATWDCEHVGRQARKAATELMHDMDNQ